MNINKRIEAIAKQLENTKQKEVLSYVSEHFDELTALKPYLKAGGVTVLPFFQEVWVDGIAVEGEDSPFRVYISVKKGEISCYPDVEWSSEEVLTLMKCLHGLYKDYEMYL